MAAARCALAALLVAIAVSSAFAVRQGSGRELLQSGVSCPAQIPACTARRCTTRILDSKETYVCLRCQKGYSPVKGSDGKSVVQCVCPAGTYQFLNGTTKSCMSCPTGSYCPGGNPKARLPTDNIGGNTISCNNNGTTGLTTKSDRSSRPADCIATAGFVLPTTPGGSAQQCSGSTYAPAYNKLKACLPCQSGLAKPTWFTGIQSDKMDVCQVPPGKFWELNVVRDCPMGLYREEFVRTDNKSAIACKSCPEGWTTAQIGTDLLSKCNVLLPGYKAKDVPAGNTSTDTIVLPGGANSTDFIPYETEACPIGYYYDGTTATLGCVACPYGSTTLKNGSISVDDCMVAPGFYVDSDSNTVEMCPTTPVGNTTDGYYRAGWKSYKEVMDTDGTKACTPCGAGIMSTPRDADERPGAAADSLVPASAASCYINPGWGITFDPADFTKFKAIAPCPANTYGVANVTYGLINAPCKACTKNLYSLEASTRFDACKNPGGFGYTSEGANQCPDGFWAAKDSMAPCEQCPPGRTTLYVPGNGTFQDNIDDCIVPPGSGVYNGNDTDPWNPTNGGSNNTLPAKPCPVGFYSTNDTIAAAGSNNPTCQVCPNNGSTAAPGSTECTVCKAGYGKDHGVCSPCKYGGYNLGTSDSCMDCPSTTFNDFVGDGYTSYGITVRSGLSGPESCVPRYAQLPKPVGDRMGLPDDMLATVSVPAAANDNDFVKGCIERCPADKCCIAEMEKDASGVMSCKHAILDRVSSAVNGSDPKLYYKLPPSEMAAASKDVQKKTISSGIYAVCSLKDYAEEAKNGSIGTSNNPTLVEAGRNAIEWNVQCSNAADCKKACDADATCWGFIWHNQGKDGAAAFALRGGESWLGGRTFFASPDGNGGNALHVVQTVAPFNMDELAW